MTSSATHCSRSGRSLSPACVAIAILRYRLWDIDVWDIDVIINKALVYGSLTLLLTAVYAGMVVAMEGFARLLGGAIGGKATDQSAVLVISTLAIAALFQPARRGVSELP